MKNIKEKPNIIQIIWHDLGRYLSCYRGGSVISPNIDKMAEEGMLFNNHYSTGSVCVPSRCSILTGRYPHAQELWRFNDKEVTIPNTLRAAGYATCRFGFHEEKEYKSLYKEIDIDLAGKRLLGYEYTWKESRDSMDIANKFCDFLINERPQKPFFASVAFYDVHWPNTALIDKEDIDRAKLPENLPHMPDTSESKKEIAMFEKRIRKADEAVGLILNTIRKQGLKEKTIVYFTTDHGIDFPRAKMTVYDPGIEAALIFWGAETIPAGKIDNNLHSHMDIFPTLIELVDVPIPETVQGESFAPVFKDNGYKPREFIVAERTWEVPYDPVRAIRTNKYKYIRNYCPGWPIPVPPDYVDSVGKEIIEKKYSVPRPFEELYDIENDPYELNNLAENEGCQSIKNELWRKLEEILVKDNDVVLDITSYMSYLKELIPGKWIKGEDGFKLSL